MRKRDLHSSKHLQYLWYLSTHRARTIELTTVVPDVRCVGNVSWESVVVLYLLRPIKAPTPARGAATGRIYLQLPMYLILRSLMSTELLESLGVTARDPRRERRVCLLWEPASSLS